MANLITLCILILIGMLFSKNPIIVFLGIIIIAILFGILNTDIIVGIIVIIIIIVIFGGIVIMVSAAREEMLRKEEEKKKEREWEELQRRREERIRIEREQQYEQRRIELEKERERKEQERIEKERQDAQKKKELELERKTKEQLKIEKEKREAQEKEDLKLKTQKRIEEYKKQFEEKNKEMERKKQERLQILKQKKEEEKRKEKEHKKEVLKKLKDREIIIKKTIDRIFDDIIIFTKYNSIIIDLSQKHNKKNIAKDIIYIIKRILAELPENYQNEDLKKMKINANKVPILVEIGYFPNTYNNSSFKKTETNDFLKILYNHAIEILEEIMFTSERDKFNKNEEFYNMYISLKSNIDNEEYILEKMFSMYKAFYKKTFSKILTKQEFKLLLDNTRNEEKFENYKTDFFKKNEIFVSGIIKVEEEKILKLVEKMEKSTYFETFSATDQETFSYTINCVFNKISTEEKIIVLENMQRIYSKFVNDAKKNELLKEKERLLKGDFSKEIEMKKLELEYTNIETGYQFEEYIANLYSKLGYKIEEVTKKSGDQGADVIAYKGKVKFVIQVKFYNGSVGNKAVQEVAASIKLYKANKAIVVTNSTFTTSAIELADANDIELVDGEKIEQFKKKIIEII